MLERLPADARIGERAADGEPEVVRPHAWRQAVLKRRAEDVDPQLLSAGVDERLRAGRGHVDAGRAVTAPERAHVHDNAARGERLSAPGVTLPARRHGERRRRRGGEPDELGDVSGRGGMEHGLRRGIHHLAEVRRRLRRRVVICADPRRDAQAEKIARESSGRHWPELAGNDGEEAGEEGDRHETSPCHASLSETMQLEVASLIFGADSLTALGIVETIEGEICLCVLEAKNFHGIYRRPFGLANVDKWRHSSLSDYCNCSEYFKAD